MHAHILTNAHPQAQLNSCGCLLQMFLFPRMAEGKSIRVHYDKQEWNPRQHDIFRAWRKGNTGYGTLAHRLCSVVSLLKQGHTTYMLVCFVTCMRICVCVCVCWQLSDCRRSHAGAVVHGMDPNQRADGRCVVPVRIRKL